MASTRSTTGGQGNSITSPLAQLSEDGREVEARLIPQIYKAGERTVKRDWRMARAWLKGELSKPS
jgi:hypothetical protein